MASKFRNKPLSQQAIVITGASSGIGLATARLASERGAKVLLVSRNEDELRKIVQQLRDRGGRAEYAVADVADKEALEAAAGKAREAFGGFDAWVNDAGASVLGEIERMSLEDHRRVFETNYWGVVHGSLVAVRELKAHGGTLGQHRQRVVGPHHDAARPLLGEQVRGEGLHGRAADGAGAERGAGERHPRQARQHRHALPGARAQPARRAGHQGPAARLRPAAGGARHPLRLREPRGGRSWSGSAATRSRSLAGSSRA